MLGLRASIPTLSLIGQVSLEDGARHLCELQLQLTWYAAARVEAHHYYAILRQKIVDVSGIVCTVEQEFVITTILDAIEGSPCSVSSDLIRRNYLVLHDVSRCTPAAALRTYLIPLRMEPHVEEPTHRRARHRCTPDVSAQRGQP